MSERSTYRGLTHQCDDPDCHVPGFVATLWRMHDERNPSGPCDDPECVRCVAGLERIADALAEKDAGRKFAADVTASMRTGSYRHASNEQPSHPVSGAPSVPGVRAEVSDQRRGQPRHGVPGVPLVRLREDDSDGLTVTFGVGNDWPTPNACRRIADALDALSPARYGDILRAYANAVTPGSSPEEGSHE